MGAVKAHGSAKIVVEALSERKESPIETPWKLCHIAMITVKTPSSIHVIKNITFFLAISERVLKFNTHMQTQLKRTLL
jgi:hypothetical protein